MMDTVQEMRVNASLELPDPTWEQALFDRLERQSSWMRKMAAPSGGDFPQWRQIDTFVHNVRHVGDGPNPQLLTHLLDQLEDAFAARAY